MTLSVLSLPPKTTELLEKYLSLDIAGKNIVCPYYQNIWKKTKKPVFSGKGLPGEIEVEMKKLILQRPAIKLYPAKKIRHAMIMAGLGIDCSGLVANLLNQYLKETKNISLYKTIPLKIFSFYRQIVFKIRPRTNLSASQLTSPPISQPVSFRKIKPADLIKMGDRHVAIITDHYHKKSQTAP